MVRQLSTQCDIVVENFKAGKLAEYGLDFQSLSALRRDGADRCGERPHGLVYASISGYGQTGPKSSLAGYDFVAQAMSGLMSVTGVPGGEPMKTGVAVSDLITGLYTAVGILSALRHVQSTGESVHVDASLFECQLATMANQVGDCCLPLSRSLAAPFLFLCVYLSLSRSLCLTLSPLSLSLSRAPSLSCLCICLSHSLLLSSASLSGYSYLSPLPSSLVVCRCICTSLAFLLAFSVCVSVDVSVCLSLSLSLFPLALAVALYPLVVPVSLFVTSPGASLSLSLILLPPSSRSLARVACAFWVSFRVWM